MYSWYMPKDETLPGLGHRHDWEACVVWIDSLDDPTIVALSASYHNYAYYAYGMQHMLATLKFDFITSK
ncbi:hypothetical protein F443_15123 [Phytophthora nicotianae P1569]|uniref:Uncharacterized protein n=2 Tax=Phytophthora nicotianae TaxID=4792 RepID=V9EJD2_PHYNI|nr:hypothetical protein F443_15123 [Phytophthora nicotianae P1569]